MSDKITAKDLAEKSNIPIVPGYRGVIPTEETAIKEIAAEKIMGVPMYPM